METLRPVDRHMKINLNEHLGKLEDILNADVLTIFGSMRTGLDKIVKEAVELFQDKRTTIAVILDTLGGTAEVVERTVDVIRHHYDEVDFLIPDRAMSAGTIFAMAGDRIFMGYFSGLGPIDPQVEKDGRLFPALGYLTQYERLCKKAANRELNTAELILLEKLELVELYEFEQARELSHELLTNWLSTYKFKDWNTHSSTGKPVTDEEKVRRAEEVASVLSNNERWHSHGRTISRETLRSELRLKIENFEGIPCLPVAIDEYVGLIKDYVQRERLRWFVHTRDYFVV